MAPRKTKIARIIVDKFLSGSKNDVQRSAIVAERLLGSKPLRAMTVCLSPRLSPPPSAKNLLELGRAIGSNDHGAVILATNYRGRNLKRLVLIVLAAALTPPAHLLWP